MSQDDILTKLRSYPWRYATQDGAAAGEIARRVAAAGRQRNQLTYAELVQGIDFELPSVNQGKPFRLGVPDWTDLHRAVLGDFLGYLCLQTYEEGRFMGSCLVVSTGDRQPSRGYRDLMRDLHVLRGRSDDEFLQHWLAETECAYVWYAQHRTRN